MVLLYRIKQFIQNICDYTENAVEENLFSPGFSDVHEQQYNLNYINNKNNQWQ